MGSKILLVDIETSPSQAYIWGLWQEVTSTEMIESDWYILCWCAKWLGEKKIMRAALPDFQNYKKDTHDDKAVLQQLWKLLDEADVIVAHNGIKFDRRKINARFIMNGMTPPSPYKVIDTLQIAKTHFAFTSNRLNDLGRFLQLGKKKDTGGFQLWKDCMAGDKEAWKKMVDYCANDVALLEKVYVKLRPYASNHPNIGVYLEEETALCPKCGSSNIEYRGYYYTTISKFQRFMCKDCGGWGRLRTNELPKEIREGLATNAL